MSWLLHYGLLGRWFNGRGDADVPEEKSKLSVSTVKEAALAEAYAHEFLALFNILITSATGPVSGGAVDRYRKGLRDLNRAFKAAARELQVELEP